MNPNANDPTIYRWVLTRKRNRFAVVITMLMSVIFPALLYGFFWFIELFLGIWAVRLCFVAAGALLVWTVLLISASRDSKIISIHMDGLGLPLFSTMLLGCFIFISSSSYSPVYPGFTGRTDVSMQWFYFLLDNFLRVFLLDIPEIFEMQLSTITPLTWQARTLTVLIRAMIALGTVEMILSIYKSYFSRVQEFYGTMEECRAWLLGFLGRGELILTRRGVVTDMEHRESMLVEKFIFLFQKRRGKRYARWVNENQR